VRLGWTDGTRERKNVSSGSSFEIVSRQFVISNIKFYLINYISRVEPTTEELSHTFNFLIASPEIFHEILIFENQIERFQR
jgi:hypothetical protein